MRSDIGCRRLHPSCRERFPQDRVDDLAILEWTVRRPVAHEQRPGCRRGPLLAQIPADRLAHVWRDRQPVMALPFSANQNLTGSPVDVIELDCHIGTKDFIEEDAWRGQIVSYVAGSTSPFQFPLDLKTICRNIATINRTRLAGGFSGRLSPGNQLTPAHIFFDIAAESLPIGPPQ